MFRYSIKEVKTGLVPNIDRKEMGRFNNKVAFVIPEHEKTHLCVIDKKKKEAIDIFAPENRYPLLGDEEDGCIVIEKEIDENKEYVLRMQSTQYSYIDRRRIIKQLKNKKII